VAGESSAYSARERECRATRRDRRRPALHRLLDATPEVLEAHHVTGDDCFVLKIVATSMRHLEQINGRIGALGSVTTSVAYSSPIPTRPVAVAPAPSEPRGRARR
jgi:Lrp/AsnC family leucine-responsive transcriptional regulator